MIQCTIHMLSRSNLDKAIQNTYTHIDSDYINVITSAIYVYFIKKSHIHVFIHVHAYALRTTEMN